MLRALIGRCLPITLLFVLGCGDVPPDEGTGTGAPEPVGEIRLATIGEACTVDSDCANPCEECVSDVCAAKSAGASCQVGPVDEPCDLEDECDGAGNCIDLVQDADVVCDTDTGACEADDVCDGVSKGCPERFAPEGTNCQQGPQSGACDAANTCDGNGVCVDRVDPAGTVCDNDNGPCNPDDVCDGVNKNCPELVAPEGTLCEDDGDSICDPDDVCDGVSTQCPEVYADTSVSCQNGPLQGLCDAEDFCDGSGGCDDLVRANGEVCQAANGVCDPADTCNGSSKTCTAVLASEGTNCQSGPLSSSCDMDDTCDGSGTCVDRLRSAGFVCQEANGTCDPAHTCDANKNCLPNYAPLGTSCVAPTHDPTADPDCELADSCDGAGTCVDNFADATVECRPAGTGKDAVCDPADFCSGTISKACTNVFSPEFTPCDSGTNGNQPCEDNQDSCNATGVCVDRVQPAGTLCQSDPDTDCEADDVCNGTGKSCPELYQPIGTPCDDGFDCTEAGTSTCLANGTCDPGDANDDLCPQSQAGDPLAACATWSCAPGPATQSPVFPGAPTGCQVDDFDDPTQLCRLPAGDCDEQELCTGSTPTCPADALVPSGEECTPASCSNGMWRAAAECTGSSVDCPVIAEVPCDPYVCHATEPECRTSCTNSTHCIASHYCDAGECKPRSGSGDSCSDDSQCTASNPHCVDGVCCDVECEGQCESCNQPGSEGTCTPMPNGSEPEGDREPCAGDGTTCDGYCNGTTTTECEYPDDDVQCSDDACDPLTNVATVASFCDGEGACQEPDEVECAPYACGATQCNGDCTADSDCDDSAYCRAGICVEKRPDGEACSRAAQCTSGFCTDGVCCDSRCDGQCEACNSAGNQGTCSAVTGDPVGSRTACNGSGDCAGACDGTNRQVCAYPGLEVECRAAACEAGTATLAASCDGQGNCPASQSITCPKDCEGTVCAGDACTLDSDCPTGQYCVAATCQPQQDPGGACADDGDCASGFCTDGVCCDSACLGQCEACDVAGSEGTCSPVPAGDAPHGARTACTSDGSACAGACDGSNRSGCNYPVGTVCRAGSCDDTGSGSVSTVEATCQGTGRCPDEQQQACGQYRCTSDDAQCDGPCADDPDACAATEYCSAGICVPKGPDGSSCGGADQCQSGYCVDGVCCETACSGQCEACDVPGSVGTCAAVTGATHGGRPACEGTGPCGATCDGSDRDECGFAAENVSCGSAFCSSGVASEGQVCNGEGRCTQGETQACLSYACDGTACGTGCTTDADCTGENYCLDGVCTINTQIDAKDIGTCGCRVPGQPAPSRGWLAALALAGAAALGRRRRSPSAAARLQ